MKDEKYIHELLKHALADDLKPADELNDRIINQIMEGNQMISENKNYRRKRVFPGLAFAAVLILALGITCFAAVKFLSPEKIAEHIGDDQVAKAFESKDAVKINQTATEEGYTITLLGMTSGKNLANLNQSDLNLKTGSTYAVVAIENEDGTPMPSGTDSDYGKTPFFISPLIKGLEPWRYNIASMNGSYGETVIGGILYRMIQCDNVDIFADQGLYLCVSDTDFYDTNAYHYNEETGEITINEAYEGINLLFNLPVDAAKADADKASEYLQQLKEQWSQNGQDDANAESTETAAGIEKFQEKEGVDSADNLDGWIKLIRQKLEAGTLTDMLKDKKAAEGSEQSVTEENGLYVYKFQLQSGMGGSWQFAKSELVNGMDFTVQSEADANGVEQIYLILVQEQQDGSVLGKVYLI